LIHQLGQYRRINLFTCNRAVLSADFLFFADKT
jgi:hypothetical protein